MRPICRLMVLSVLLAVCGSGSLSARAETVLLARGDDTFGQGWLFLDASGACRIATPRHVVERMDGTLSSPDLLDSFGRLHPTGSPVAAIDEDLDLAFLTVGGAIAKEGCSRDRVRSVPLQPIIDSIKQATLEITTPTERQSLSVTFRALSRDADGGRIIVLSSLDPSASFQKGMSGGTVMSKGRPIAMLYEVEPDEGLGIALRYDIIAAELQKIGAPTPETRSLAEATRPYDSLVLVKGRISQKDTSIGSFLSGDSALHLAPVDGRVSLILDLDRVSAIQGVRINIKGLSGQGAMIIEADNDGQGFVPGARCELAAETVCMMATRRASRLRLSFTGSGDAGYIVETLHLVKG
ncbi:hypothetical protein [Hoeflea ulvae]|uniref:Serine protease n=1 Tax=Hoeflea ulvae TaxID=2983764 RepID=A0ABT3YBI0_9HYPH|nr:hypothetical protein [Hoeflea ulvae]MCY0093248.1 hypothetical protein [Hoeflea ulvae]